MEESEADREGKDLELDDVAVGRRECEEDEGLGDTRGQNFIINTFNILKSMYNLSRIDETLIASSLPRM